ncbi:signal transducer and activator of transcription C [Uranotaenia lowii]|uniref:signal transducer and activator of transcription C n=1 Tax=Uranotaenia lowii TaxID=190385 RepID=UPI00247A3F64|nr:signal transducer and activator of transcription C [Uranotaenia lowii]
MDRSIGRQGPMMSPGMSRRPGGGMPPRDNYQSHSYHQQQQSSPHQHHHQSNQSQQQQQQQQQYQQHQQQHQQQQQQQHQQQQQQSSSQPQHSQHDELIRYIHEAWNSITQDKNQTPPVFYKSVPEPRLAGFTPFDLEAWWGRRLVHKINISTHGHQ